MTDPLWTLPPPPNPIGPAPTRLPAPAWEEPPSAMQLLQLAIEKGADVTALERLVALQERIDSRRAAQEFEAAFAGFKAECPPVPRRTENTQFMVTRGGVKISRKYASLEDIEATVRPHLAAHGLSYSWQSAVIDEKNRMTVGCLVAHGGGGSRVSSATVPLESKAGCSEQQKWGIAIAYVQRFSLIAALGLTSCEEDIDGNATESSDPISEQQNVVLRMLLEDTGSDEARFCAFLGVAKIEEVPASRFQEARAALEQKARRPRA